MFGGSRWREFENDPFFGGQLDHMRRMQESVDRMMGSMLGPSFMPAIHVAPGMGARQQAITNGYQRDYGRRGERHRELAPFDPFARHNMFGGIFGDMNHMMGMMQNPSWPAQDTSRNNPNAQFYSHSSVMSYSNTGSGQPQLYQATTSTKQAGGLKETKNSVRDTETGIEKMSVGRHVGDQAHTVTRQRNRRTGDTEENQDYINLDETEAEDFNRQFTEQAQAYGRSVSSGPGSINSPHRPRAAIASHPYHYSSQHQHTPYRSAAPRQHSRPSYRERD